MKKPCHPSEPILRDWFGGFDLIVEGAADHLQVSAGSRSEICQGQAPVTTEMAVGLLKAIGSTLRFWIPLQANYATRAEQMPDQFNITKFERAV